MSIIRPTPTLICGDILAIVIVSVAGFLTHNTTPFTSRLLTTLLPVLLVWALQAPWFGLYEPRIYRVPRQAWRAALAMLLVAPLAALLRSYMLGQALVVPVFATVLGLTAAAGMFAWRLAYAWFAAKVPANG